MEAPLRRLGPLYTAGRIRGGRRGLDPRERRDRVWFRVGQRLQGLEPECGRLPHPGARPADRRTPQRACDERNIQRRAPSPLLPEQEHAAIPHVVSARRRIRGPGYRGELPESLGPQRLSARIPAVQRPALCHTTSMRVLHQCQAHRLQRPGVKKPEVRARKSKVRKVRKRFRIRTSSNF